MSAPRRDQPSLLGEDGPEELLCKDGSALLYEGVIPPDEADALLHQLLRVVPWEQKMIKVYGRTVPQPRLVAWFGDEGTVYTYSGLTLRPTAWNEPILECKQRAETVAGVQFNSALANLYRDGDDGVSWHSDHEPELGPEPVIASVSLGAPRRFDLRHRQSGETVKRVLPAGSVLVMSGRSQASWAHQVPKTKKVQDERVNVTFRCVRAR